MEREKCFKILVADNDPHSLDITNRILKRTDYKVFNATNGPECMKVLHKEKPDILLLDIKLTDANGKEICKKIKSDPAFVSVYIIGLSELKTHIEDDSVRPEEGADGYIARPVESRELFAHLKTAIRIITAEKKIERNELLLKACIDSPPDMIVLAIDTKYNYLSFNTFHKAVMLHTYGKEIEIGMNLLECITNTDDIRKSKINYSRALAGECHITVEEFGDLDRQYYETRYSPIYNDKKEIIGATAFASSVTKQKHLEESLKENERLLIESQSIAGLGSYVWNLLTGFWSSSKVMDEIFGIDEHYVRSLDGWKNIIHPDWQELMNDYVLKEVLGKGKKFDKEYLIIRKSDNEERWVHGIGELEYDSKKNPVKLIGTISDITHRKKVEESLRKSEEKFRKVFTTSPDSININRLSDGMYVSINNGFTKALGYTEEMVIGKTSLELNIWNNPADRTKLVTGLKKTGVVQNLEANFRCNDGSIISGMMSASLIDIDGVPHIISITRDITEREKFEMAIKESEVRFRELIELAPDGILLGSKTGVITGANSSLIQMTGRSLNNIIGSPIDTLFSPEELNTAPLRYDLLKKGKSVASERNIHRPDGRVVNIEMLTKMMPDGSYQSIFHDVTKRKIAEEQVRRSNEQYNNLVSKIPVGVYILRSKPDGAFNLEFVSLRMANMIDNTVEALLADVTNVFKSIHPEERDGFIRLNQEGIQSCSPFDWKGRFLYKNNIRWMHVSSTPDPQADGDVLWHGIIVDISDQIQAELALNERSKELQKELERKRKAALELKKSHEILEQSKKAALNLLEDIKQEMHQRKIAEAELSKLNNELEHRVNERTLLLEAANTELQAFAYSVSHDLRAPLRAIDGFSKFILEDYGTKLDAEGQRLLGLIRANTQKMDQLIVDILALSRVTRSEHRVSKVDMTKLVLSMLNEVASHEVQLKLNIAIDKLHDTFADPTYIKQVWINLISNAIKFTSLEDKPEIRVGSYVDNGFIVYFVKDNGVGFNPEYGHKLFGVFQRLHRSDEFEGTGVGLAIVKRIVSRHGGTVWAEGIEGEGASFYFSLPDKNLRSG